MWKTTLGISVKIFPVETNAYNIEGSSYQVQFGFTQWNADFPDPYDALALNLITATPDNAGNWSNATFDHLVQQAQAATGDARLALYAQAEQLALQDVGWLPLDTRQWPR